MAQTPGGDRLALENGDPLALENGDPLALENGDPLALENQVCYALAVAARTVIGLYRPILEPLGLTHPQYLVMLALWEQSPRTVRGLATALRLEPATLSPLLKRLEAAGYVGRRRQARDERMLDITLTDSGRALREVAETIPPRVAQALDLSVPELEQLREVLHRVIAASASASVSAGTNPPGAAVSPDARR